MESLDFKKRLRELTALPIVLLLLVAVILSFQIYRQRQVALFVDRVDRQISQTSRIMKLLVDLETGFRGYMLSGQFPFLEPYERAATVVQGEIQAIQRQTPPGEEELARRFAQVGTALTGWLDYARDRIAKRHDERTFRPPFFDAEGKKRMDAMRADVDRILQLEEEARSETTTRYDREFRTTLFATYSLAVLAGLIISLFARGLAIRLRDLFAHSLETIRKHAEQYRAVFDGVKDYGIALLAADGTVETWSPGAERLTGYLASEVVGKSISRTYPEDDHAIAQLKSNLNQAEAHGKYELEGFRSRKDGSRYWADVVLTALFDPHGKLRGFSTIFRDFSKRRQLEEERAHLIRKLQEGLRSRDDFMMLASHELKTPMTSIALHLQMVEKAAKGEPSRPDAYVVKKPILNVFHRQVERMNDLIESMLEVSRIHSGKFPLRLERASLSELTVRIANDLEAQFEDSGCPLSVRVEPGIEATFDRFRIEQALTHLLLNALKFGCVAPIEFELTRVQDLARFSIKDVGPGIPKEHHERIFERYGRLAGVHDSGGLGLGLYISRKHIEAHGGRIWVKSEPGAGATFIMELPLEGSTP